MPSKTIVFLFVISAVVVAFFLNKQLIRPVEVPPIKDGFFGSGHPRKDDPKIDNFTISVSEEILKDLKQRLENTRFFEPLENAKFKYGINANYLKKLHRHWLDSYSWKKQENILNQFKHFRTEIEGLKVHFIHAKPPKGKYETVIPLLLVHGWPGSVWEFHEVLPLLTNPSPSAAFAFEVIAPSIPGYAWSDAPKKMGFGPEAAARVFGKLMQRLGFQEYVCQGGDWGAVITAILATMHPERVRGLHINFAKASFFPHPVLFLKMLIGTIFPSLVVSPQDYHKVYPMMDQLVFALQESGYMHIQATKPDTVGFALQDSPMGLAAYILEKFSTWTNKAYREFEGGGLDRHWTMDSLLTNVMIYWTTGSVHSSQRFYKECFADPNFDTWQKAPVTVPTGVAACPHELAIDPESFLSYKFLNLTSYRDQPRCGHFFAFEEPRLFAADVFSFVQTLFAPPKSKQPA